MQYKVPQNVDIADKVIAGLTLRQFMFLMVAGGIILMSNYIFVSSLRFLFIPVAIILGVIGLALAFLKVNDRPFEIFLLSAAKTFLLPSRRVWQKENLTEIKKPVAKAEEIKPPQEKKSVSEIKSNLEQLASIVDSGGTSADIERITNIKSGVTSEPTDLNDVLAETEQPSGKLEKIIDDATNFVAGQKKEQPISTMASVHKKKDDFKYDNLKLKNKLEVEEIVSAVNEKQQESEGKSEND
jgi:hypothetical protein